MLIRMDSQIHPLEQWRRDEAKRRGRPFPAYEAAAELDCSPARFSQVVRGGAPSAALGLRIKEVCGISLDALYEAAATKVA